MRDLRLLQLPLVEHFQGNNELALLLSSEEDVAKLAPAKSPYDLKVFDFPLLFSWLLRQ